MRNHVFIATSLDGYIADKNDSLDWLPAPDESKDFGYNSFMEKVDAIVMGKNTFNMVLSFGIEWPYTKPVYVLSNSLKSVPKKLESKVFLLNTTPKKVVENLEKKGYKNLYIDGGICIQNFLEEDLIDEITVTIIPTLLGTGKSLFGKLSHQVKFNCIETKVIEGIVQNYFVKD